MSLSSEDIADEVIGKSVKALDEIHSHGVLHGDLATGSIPYNKEMQEPVTIDFGMAIRKTDMSEE